MTSPLDRYLPVYTETHRERNVRPRAGVHEILEERQQDDKTVQKKLPTLGDLEKDYVLFTVAPLVLHKQLDRDLLQEFVAKYPAKVAEECVAILDSERFLFFGFPKDERYGVDYNRRLFAITKKRWSLLANFIGSAAFFKRETQYYAKVYQQAVTVVDEFALRKRSVITQVPTATVHVFNISSTLGHAVITPAVFPNLPRFKVLPPTADVLDTSQKLFRKIF